MSTFTSNNPAPRVGKIKGEILAHAVGLEVLSIVGQQKPMPRNQGDTVIFRRYLPYGASATNQNTQNRPMVDVASHELTEGQNPAADTLQKVDVPVPIKEFGCLYELTNRTVDLYEDDVPMEMKKQCGERIGLLREMVTYGAVKACTNVFYAGSATSRDTVASKITLAVLRKASRNLQANHAKRVTGILAPSVNIGTNAVEASYLVFVHSDAEADIRDLAGFTPVAEYGSRKTVSPYELGSVENFRFVTSPELAAYNNAGALVASTGLLASTTNVDVYPFIITGEDAWGQLALRGASALDPTYIPPGQKDKTDPLGLRGYVGARFYMNAMVLNDGWMAVIEAGVSDLA